MRVAMKVSVLERNLGDMGESEFQRWCTHEGFQVQKSHQDRLGWDYLLEHLPARTDDRPLDGQNAMPKYLVQVKATEDPHDPPRIKLSALKHLVDADLPAAIAVLVFEKDSREPSRCLLAPVNDKVIYTTLRRVRREEAKGNRAINRISVPVDLSAAEAVGTAGEGLSGALDKFFGEDPSVYIRHKALYRDNCGKGYPMVGGFFVPGEDAGRKVGDLFLGRSRELEVTDLTIESRRFGIALPNDRQVLRQAIVELEASPLMGATIEMEARTGEWASVPVDVYVMPPPISEIGGSRIRLANSTIEMLLDFDAGRAEFTFDYDGAREVDLNEAVSLVEIGALLAQPEKTMTVVFKDTRMPLTITGEPGPFRHWIPLAPVLRRIVSSVGRSRFQPRSRVKLDEFYDWLDRHASEIALASTGGVNMMFPRWDDDHVVDGQDAVLVPLPITLTGLLYTALVEVPIVATSRDHSEIKIVGGEPRVIAEVVRAAGADTTDFIDMAIETFHRETGNEKPALIVAGGFSTDQPS